MKAIVFDKIGLPENVLRLAEVPVPEVKEGEVLIKMTSASVNPGDFLFIQNLYPEPKKPVFPQQTGGNHGAGIIEKTGRNVSLKTGAYVAFSYYNTWAEYAVVPEEWVIPMPPGFPPEKASQFLNLVTAWDVVQLSGVQPGQWLVITAGNSTVSVMAAQFARHKGIRVISTVRNVPSDIDLETVGVEAVIDLSRAQKTFGEQLMNATGNKGVHGIIDHVGGPLFTELIKHASFGATVVLNGGLSEKKYELHHNDIYLNGLEIKSHIYRYFFLPPGKEDRAMLDEILKISSQDDFKVPVAGLHSLDDYMKAIAPENKGKHIFEMTD